MFLLKDFRLALFFVVRDKEFHTEAPENAKLLLTKSILVGGRMKFIDLCLVGALRKREEIDLGTSE